MPAWFLRRYRKGGAANGRGDGYKLGGTGGGEIIIRMYLWKKSIANKRIRGH